MNTVAELAQEQLLRLAREALFDRHRFE
ncbi:hypothetical protein LCGC14_2170130, partial [marine sediment metagenome]